MLKKFLLGLVLLLSVGSTHAMIIGGDGGSGDICTGEGGGWDGGSTTTGTND